MRDPHDLTVRLQALDGRWETVGLDRYRGVVAEHFTAAANRWGSDTCSFDLRRDPGAIHPDLSAFTPCEVDIAGLLSWSGRVRAAPSREGADSVISVQGQGWQYHLDDLVYERKYVHTNLSDYRDVRDLLTANLGIHRSGYQVTNGAGVISLVAPNGVPVVAGTACGVVYDFGLPGVRRVSWNITSSNDTAAFAAYIIGHDTPYWGEGVGREDYLNNLTLNSFGGNTTGSASSTNPHRYVTLLLYNAVTNGTPAVDQWFRFNSVRLYGETSYESGNQSVLRLDDIANDALDRTTILLSPDRGGIEPGTFDIPEAIVDGSSPREVIEAFNAYENFETKIDVDRRPIIRPRPTAPIYETADGEINDVGNDGESVHNLVIVKGEGPGGEQLSVERGSPQAGPRTVHRAVSSTYLNETLTAPPAAFFPVTPITIGLPYGVGVPLLIVIDSGSVTGATWTSGRFQFGDVAAGDYAQISVGAPASWAGREVLWVPRTTTSTFGLRPVLDAGSYAGANSTQLNFTVYRGSTILDRLRQARAVALPVDARMVPASAERIGDLWLSQHRRQPFRGSCTATGQHSVRRVLGGATVHPGHLLRDTGELVRFSTRIDPDTGDWGRDGEIDTVTYNHDELAATVTIDENRAGFETLLSRLAVVVGR
jgi:hypothetical protein